VIVAVTRVCERWESWRTRPSSRIAHASRTQARSIILGLFAVGGCRTAPIAQAPPVPSVIQRSPVYLDSAGVANGTALLRIAVRSVPRPTEGLGEAVVLVYTDPQHPEAQAVSNASGLVRFPAVRQGHYQLSVRRIGYEQLKIELDIEAGCATDVEAYLAEAYIGLEAIVVDDGRASKKRNAEPPSTIRVSGSRSTITTCTLRGKSRIP